MRIALLFLMLTLSSFAQGQTRIYKVVDANGNITFTDKPPISTQEESSAVELNQINISAPPPERARNARIDNSKPEGNIDYDITITSPPDSTTIPMGPGNFSLSASVSPALENGDKLQLILNGEPYGRPQSTSTWGLTNVLRGAHDLSIQAVSNSGKVLSQSRPVRVYVLRPSKLYRN
ncbi:MAG: DUF4124 domain-containing protein [Aequoribacter sp.]|jgi:hypothetical protein